MHSFSTGLILIGVQKMIAETVSEQRIGAAQGLAFFANGLSMALVTLASGPLYHRFGVDGFFAMILVAALGLGFIAVSVSSSPKLRLRW